MPVDVHTLAEATTWMGKIEEGFGRGLGLDNLAKSSFWSELSKTKSYSLPSLLANAFMHLIALRDNLTELHDNPDLIASQRQVIALQAELLQCKNDQLQTLQTTVKTSVEDTMKTEMKSYSQILQKHVPQPTIANETVKTIVQTVVQEEDRSKSLMVFGLPEEEDEVLSSKVGEVFEELGEKPRIEASRLGMQNKDKTKVRPVKVTLSSSVAANQILAKARRLRLSTKHNSVFICQDRSPADRAKHRLLVEELKKRRTANPGNRFYIKGGVLCDGGLRENKA